MSVIIEFDLEENDTVKEEMMELGIKINDTFKFETQISFEVESTEDQLNSVKSIKGFKVIRPVTYYQAV